MSKGRSIGLAVVSLAPALAGAQTVDELVAKHLAARGGAAKITAIESVRMTAKVRGEGGREALVVREQKRPGRVRTEFTAQGVTGVYAFDGERGWRVSPFDGELGPGPMPALSVALAREEADIGGPLLDWKAKGHRVELAGHEPVDGRDAWKLKVTLKNGDVRHLYLDAQTFQHVRTRAWRDVAGRPVEVESTFGDHRETAGVIFPHDIAIGVTGRPGRLGILVAQVEVDLALDDARFAMPSALP